MVSNTGITATSSSAIYCNHYYQRNKKWTEQTKPIHWTPHKYTSPTFSLCISSCWPLKSCWTLNFTEILMETNEYCYRYDNKNNYYLHRTTNSKMETKKNNKKYFQSLLQKLYLKTTTKKSSTTYNDRQKHVTWFDRACLKKMKINMITTFILYMSKLAIWV